MSVIKEGYKDACLGRAELPSGVAARHEIQGGVCYADMGTVESVALLSNSRDNGFTGVNLYCDDEASFVDAPPNPRATEIAFCCGKQMQVC